jgi:hypothetical protein
MVLQEKRGRGQVSGFTLLGIVLVAVVILLFFLRGQLGLDTILPGRSSPEYVGDHITQCLLEVVPEYLDRIGIQGGYLSTPPGTFRLHQDITVSYLCYNIEGSRLCQNRMLTPVDMEQELAAAIDKGLNTCIDFGPYRKRGSQLTVGQRSVLVEIGPDLTRVTVKQPLRLVRGDIVVDEDTFSETFDYPLGRLYSVSQDIVNGETTFGEFDQLSYMLAHKGLYLMDKQRPYPDKLYALQTKDHPFVFQFFIEGEATNA